MTTETIQTLIGGLGFPIFASIALGYYINSTQKEMIKTLNEVNKTLASIGAKIGIKEEKDND